MRRPHPKVILEAITAAGWAKVQEYFLLRRLTKGFA